MLLCFMIPLTSRLFFSAGRSATVNHRVNNTVRVSAQSARPSQDFHNVSLFLPRAAPSVRFSSTEAPKATPTPEQDGNNNMTYILGLGGLFAVGYFAMQAMSSDPNQRPKAIPRKVDINEPKKIIIAGPPAAGNYLSRFYFIRQGDQL